MRDGQASRGFVTTTARHSCAPRVATLGRVVVRCRGTACPSRCAHGCEVGPAHARAALAHLLGAPRCTARRGAAHLRSRRAHLCSCCACLRHALCCWRLQRQPDAKRKAVRAGTPGCVDAASAGGSRGGTCRSRTFDRASARSRARRSAAPSSRRAQATRRTTRQGRVSGCRWR